MVFRRSLYGCHIRRNAIDIFCVSDFRFDLLIQSNRFGIFTHISVLEWRCGLSQSRACCRTHYADQSSDKRWSDYYADCQPVGRNRRVRLPMVFRWHMQHSNLIRNYFDLLCLTNRHHNLLIQGDRRRLLPGFALLSWRYCHGQFRDHRGSNYPTQSNH